MMLPVDREGQRPGALLDVEVVVAALVEGARGSEPVPYVFTKSRLSSSAASPLLLTNRLLRSTPSPCGRDAVVAAVLHEHVGEGHRVGAWFRLLTEMPGPVVFWMAPPVQLAPVVQSAVPVPVTVRAPFWAELLVQMMPLVPPVASISVKLAVPALLVKFTAGALAAVMLTWLTSMPVRPAATMPWVPEAGVRLRPRTTSVLPPRVTRLEMVGRVRARAGRAGVLAGGVMPKAASKRGPGEALADEVLVGVERDAVGVAAREEEDPVAGRVDGGGRGRGLERVRHPAVAAGGGVVVDEPDHWAVDREVDGGRCRGGGGPDGAAVVGDGVSAACGTR